MYLFCRKNVTDESFIIRRSLGVTVYEWKANSNQLVMINNMMNNGYSENQIMETVAPNVYKHLKTYTHFFSEPVHTNIVIPKIQNYAAGSVSTLTFQKYGTGLKSYASLKTQGTTTELELLHKVYDNNTGKVIAAYWKGISSPISNLTYIDHTIFCESADGTYHSWVQFRALKADGHWQVENKLSLPISYNNPYQ